MAMPGIEIDGDIAIIFNNMKTRSTYKWITFKISDKLIKVDEVGDGQPTESKDEDRKIFDEQVKAKMTVSEPRYILYEFSFTLKDGKLLKAIAFIYWCDDNTRVKTRMLYSSGKDSIKKAFSGIGIEFIANQMGDLDYDFFAAEVEKSK